MKYIAAILSLIFKGILAQTEFPEDYQVISKNLTREFCLKHREEQKVPDEEDMKCLARSMANSALKAFYPVENNCDSKLNINSSGEKCYSVRALRNNLNNFQIKEHKNKQSLFLTLYYGLTTKELAQDIEKITNVELTLRKQLNCSVAYKPIKRLSHGRGSGSSYSINNITMDSTTNGGGIGISIGYKSPFQGFIGGVDFKQNIDYSWSNNIGKGQGTSMSFKVPDGATCEPRLYQAALFCHRQSGKLKTFGKNGLFKEIVIKEDSIDKGLLMPLDEKQSDFFIPLLACAGR